jgi:hypothetical protein
LEFGTAGIHQPFMEILNTATELLGEKTFAYIDAGESVCKKYISFLCETDQGFSETENITVAENTVQIKGAGGAIIDLVTSMNIYNELSA